MNGFGGFGILILMRNSTRFWNSSGAKHVPIIQICLTQVEYQTPILAGARCQHANPLEAHDVSYPTSAPSRPTGFGATGTDRKSTLAGEAAGPDGPKPAPVFWRRGNDKETAESCGVQPDDPSGPTQKRNDPRKIDFREEPSAPIEYSIAPNITAARAERSAAQALDGFEAAEPLPDWPDQDRERLHALNREIADGYLQAARQRPPSWVDPAALPWQ